MLIARVGSPLSQHEAMRGILIHCSRFWSTPARRRDALFITQIAILVALSSPLIATGQSPARQQPKATKTANSNDDDSINADRPGFADGSSVVGARRLQVESGIQLEFRRSGDTRQHTLFVPALLRIGIGKHWEARIEGNTFNNENDFDLTGRTHHAGFAPFTFGFKYQIEESKGVRHPALGAIVRIGPPFGTSDFRTHHATGDLRLTADWDFTPKLSLNPNVGVGVYEDHQGKTFVSAITATTLSYSASKRLNPFVDFGLLAPEERNGKSALIVDVGIAYVVRRKLQLDASAGKGVHGNTLPHPFVSFGISYRSDVLRR